jgi:hypothetical protein
MVLLLVGVVLGCAAVVWLWKVPVKKLANAMKKSGSSSFEAYTVILLLSAGIAFAIYMIVEVI